MSSMRTPLFFTSKLFNGYLTPFILVTLSNTIIFPAFSANRTETISSGSKQLTGDYELTNSSYSQSVIRITGANTTVTGDQDVTITVQGPATGISLTDGTLTLDGSSITSTNNSNTSSQMLTNTNGSMALSNVQITTNTINASGISTNGSKANTTIENSHIKGGYSAIYGQNGATLTVNNSQIDSIGNYGIILSNNSHLTGSNNEITLVGDVYSQSGIYAASNINNTSSTIEMDKTKINILHGKSGVEAEQGGIIKLTNLEITGNINVGIRASKTGNIEVSNGSVILDQGAIASAQGTSDQAIANIILNNITAESSGTQNYYENNKNTALINGREYSNIVINGGAYHAKGTEQHGVWSMNDSSIISLNNTSITTDTDKSIAIKSNGYVKATKTSVKTSGNSANALYSEAIIEASQLDINTSGDNSSAIFANNAGQVDIDNSTINTTGKNASILATTNNSTINAQAITATTSGDNSHAVLTTINGYTDQKSQINMTDSRITASGNNAAGIAAINQTNTSTQTNQYQADISLNNTSITSENGDGLYVKGMDTNVSLTNGSSLVADNGRLIYAESYLLTNHPMINSHVNIVAESNSSLIGSVDYAQNNTVDMQLKGASWQMLSSSKLSNLSNLSNSVVDLTSHNGQFNTLTIEGNYTGDTYKNQANNGRLIVNTHWDDTSSSSDLLDIKGTATGYTQVQTHNGIIGNVTQDADLGKYSADVIKVADHNLGSNSFYGFADTTGAGQALLVQKDANTYAWYIPQTPVTPITPGVTPIKPEVPGFTAMPVANMNLGYTTLGTLHQRVSEQQSMSLNNPTTEEGQVWGRMLGSYTDNKGENRFNYRSKTWGFQIGYDFSVHYNPNNGSKSHTGIMLTYSKDDLQFNDRNSVSFNQVTGNYVASRKKTGSGQTDWVGLGGYYTYYTKSGSYLDLVGNLNYLYNKYNSVRSDKTNNKAYGTTLSAEVGHPFRPFNDNWFIEPQAQIVYQYLHFTDFKTLYNIKVNQPDSHGLRGRVGFRLGYDKNTTKDTLYLTGNIHHDFIHNKATEIGDSRIKDRFANTWMDVGIGVQTPITNNTYLYSDIRYNHTLDNHQGVKKGYEGSVGLKYQW